MAKSAKHGVRNSAELNPDLVFKNTRSPWVKAGEVFKNNNGVILFVLGFFIVLLAVAPQVVHLIRINPYQTHIPQIGDFLFLLGLFYYWLTPPLSIQYPYESPRSHFSLQDDEQGILMFGYDGETGAGLWFNNTQCRSHMLLVGTTGSGKSRTLLSLAYNVLLWGGAGGYRDSLDDGKNNCSGLLFVDGKADNTILWLFYSLVRRVDRVDDFLLINYITGAELSDKNIKFSHKVAPFAIGSAEQVRSIIVGLMRDSGGDGAMWKGRASALLQAIMPALVFLRDTTDFFLSINAVRDHLPLEQIVILSQRPDIPEKYRLPIKRFLNDLPGFNEEDAESGQINPEAYKQLGFLTMQFSESLGSLGEQYDHIYNTVLSEADFQDIIFNRRIVFCMLPALQKDPDALAGLGKMILSSVRSALGPALGALTEGRRRDVIDRKITNSNFPFIMIFDEISSYLVKGIGLTASQARSLSIGICFCNQSWANFPDNDSEKESKVIFSNTGIKGVMKLEDSKDTFDLFSSRAGEAYTSVSEGNEVRGAMSNYKDRLSTRYDKQSRFNIRDFTKMGAGEIILMYEDTISHARCFYADPVLLDEIEIPRFLHIMPPGPESIHKYEKTHQELKTLFGLDQENPMPRLSFDDVQEAEKTVIPNKPFNAGLDDLIRDLKLAQQNDEQVDESALYALGIAELRLLVQEAELRKRNDIEKLAQADKEKAQPPPTLTEPQNKPEEAPISNAQPEPLEEAQPENASADSKPTADKPHLAIIAEESETNSPLRSAISEQGALFLQSLQKSVIKQFQKTHDTLSAAEEMAATPFEQLTRAEQDAGRTHNQAQKEANDTLAQLAEQTQYIQPPTPTKEPAEKLTGGLANLKRELNKRDMKDFN